MQRIDSHVHLGRWPRWGLELTLADLHRIMRKWRYAGAVVIPALVGDPIEANKRTLNVLCEGGSGIPDGSGLYFFAWFHSTPGNESLGWLEEHADLISGLKFHGSISQQSITDPGIEPYLAFADCAKLPLLYHAGRSRASWPGPVKELAPSYPGINFIIAHAGGTALDRALATMSLFSSNLPENVYVDLSTIRWPNVVRRIVDHYGRERVLYGSDLPFNDMNMVKACLKKAGVWRDKDIMRRNLLCVL